MHSTSSDVTEQIGEKLGRRLRGGEVIELVSDLGGGKTTLVRGISRGMGSKDHVASPTFTISRLYKSPKFTIYHFDFYRLSEPGIMKQELAEVLSDPQNITVIEWGVLVQDVLPKRRLRINFQVNNDESRNITFDYPEAFEYLIKELSGDL